MNVQIDLNNPKSVELGDAYFKIISEQFNKEFAWIKKLRSEGIKGACDRLSLNTKIGYVDFNHPIFDDAVIIGDKIAVGRPDDYIIIELLSYNKEAFCKSFMYKELS